MPRGLRVTLGLLALVLVAGVASGEGADAANAATNDTREERPWVEQYLEGTDDPRMRLWWYASLVVLVLVLAAALWFMGVIPR